MPRWNKWWCAPWKRSRPGRRTGRSVSCQAGGDLAVKCAADLAGIRASAVAHGELQDLPGSAADRQDPGRGGPVSGAAYERGGVRGGREAADPGPGTDSACAADGARHAGAAQLRLRPARHHRPVRGTEHRHGEGDREAVRTAPGGRLPRLPRRDRPPDRARPDGPRDLRQPLCPQGAAWCTSGCSRTHGSICTSHPRTRRGSIRSSDGSPNYSGRCLERGVFCSLDELKTALEDWIKTWNEDARPFKWTKTADQIIDRICRYCDRISGPVH